MRISIASQEYTSGSHTFTFPVGVYWVWATGIAGGGAGSSTIHNNTFTQPGGAGGGAGESVENFLLYGYPGATLLCTVGAGGTSQTAAGTVSHYGNVLNISSTGGPFYHGNGGGDTSIGPIKLLGGYGGVTYSGGGTGGMGGGFAACRAANGLGAQGSNSGQLIAPTGSNGYQAVKANAVHWRSGSGGGAADAVTSRNGGPFGPWLGGVGGSNGSSVSGGAGGGASLFGPGGDGGAASSAATTGADAPSVPAGSYGAGGGAAGGCNVAIPGGNGLHGIGAQGGGGYILLTWIRID